MKLQQQKTATSFYRTAPPDFVYSIFYNIILESS